MHVILPVFAVSILLTGCIDNVTGDTMPNDSASANSVFAVIAETDRERLAENIEQLTRVARTECSGGYALELYAPSQVSYEAALQDTNKRSPNAMFWVMRVPDNPPYTTYEMTTPNALDKPEWFAERLIDGRWEYVSKPPSLGPAHDSSVDVPVTFKHSEVRGDNVLPHGLSGPLSKVLRGPISGRYRIHFAPFTANIGGTECSLNADFWEVNFI